MVSAIWLVSIACVGSMFVQNYAILSGQFAKSRSVNSGQNAQLHLLSLRSPPQRKFDGKKESAAAIASLGEEMAVKEQGSDAMFRVRFKRNVEMLESFRRQHGVDSIRKVITAFTEPPLQDWVPGTGSRDNPDDKSFGIAPEFKTPLPRRTTTPDDLRMHLYPGAQTCHDLPAKFPVDRGLQMDERGQPVVWNLGHAATPPDFPETEAQHCPVEMDPFLPWIHDVFAAPDGRTIEFIAQNMRRCRTGKSHTDDVNRLVPQVALMQAVSVQRINETIARELAPDLWQASSAEADAPRYKLAPWAEASEDGMETRFICRFHTSIVEKGKLSTVQLGETLSVFPFNYEMMSYRKNMRSLLTPKGNDAGFFWASNLHFRCPVPIDLELRQAIADGSTVLKDGTPTVHVDIVPIRTSVRYEEVYLTPDQIGPTPDAAIFDPVARWGVDNILPLVEASGRWANIPLCAPPTPVLNVSVVSNVSNQAKDMQPIHSRKEGVHKDLDVAASDNAPPKPHYLSACLWASAEFEPRGEAKLKNTDTAHRLQEWIEFHLLVGFDHIYVYDNTGAHTNETTLAPILSNYPASQVTRIDWPSTICNNNRPSDDSAGERSSQYAAEASCRV